MNKDFKALMLMVGISAILIGSLYCFINVFLGLIFVICGAFNISIIFYFKKLDRSIIIGEIFLSGIILLFLHYIYLLVCIISVILLITKENQSIGDKNE